MRKLSIIFAFLLSCMGGVNPVSADELTVANGTTKNSYVPIQGQNADYGMKGEYIIPSSNLTDMSGKIIKAIKLYASTNNSSAKPNYGPFTVFLKEVESTSPYTSSSSAFQGTDGATTVYEGTLVISSNELFIEFTQEYEYNGGNLLVGFYKDKGGNYLSNDFYGVNQDSYTACTAYSSSGISSISTGTGRMFIPKTTFTYEESATTTPRPKSIMASNISATTAEISWTAGSNDNSETAWDLEYKTVNDDDNSWTEVHAISNSITSYTLENLSSNTSYDVRVRGVFGTENSDWRVGTFKTLKVATAANGYTDDFESANNWDFINGTLTNAWAWGTATNNGGTHAMYISNDGGTTNAYTVGSSAMVYATKLFSFESGDYTISYDWIGNGESTYDFLRVALVPGDAELTASSTQLSGLTATALPSGWIALDGSSKLNLSTSWSTKSTDLSLESSANYTVVFAWRNDGSGGTNPPAAIDNFSITKHALSAPTELTATTVTAISATLSWTANSGETSWDIAFGETGFNPDAAGTIVAVSENPYTLTVAPETSYDVYVRAKNDQGESGWSEKVSFTTPELYPKPTTASSTNTTAKSATIGWTENGTATAWEVVFDTNASFDKDAATPILADSNPFTLTGLEPATTYYAYVRSYIDGTNHSGWSEVFSFTTGYGVPFTEEFSSSSIPTGWNRYSGLMSGVIAGTTSLTPYTSNYGGWTIDSSWAKVNIYGTSLSNWLVSPNIEIDGNCTLSFDVAYQAYSGGGAPQTTGTDDKFVVLVKDGDTWNQLALWDNDDATESKVLNDIEYQTGGENVILDLSAFNGKSIQIAFYAESTVSNADNNLWLDNVNIAIDTPVSVTTDNYGYATFSCDQALDLTTENMPEGLEAYKAAVNGTKVNLTKLDQTVPANTGILLKGNAATEYVLMKASEGTTVEGNDFLATDGTSVITSDDTNFIFVMKKNQETLTFSKYVGTAALPVNKAYLEVPAANFDGGNARLSFTFEEGEATGIATMEGASRMNDGAVYNLQGQKVEKAQKGLYIVNGKKVVIK